MAYPELPPPGPARRRSGAVWWIVLATVTVLALFCAGLYITMSLVKSGVAAMQTDAARVGDRILGQLRRDSYMAVWNEAAPEFRQTVTAEKFAAFVTDVVEENVGWPQSWQGTGFDSSRTDGRTTMIYTYQVQHEHGSSVAIIRVDDRGRLLYLKFAFDQ